jgi:hypothetical protein
MSSAAIAASLLSSRSQARRVSCARKPSATKPNTHAAQITDSPRSPKPYGNVSRRGHSKLVAPAAGSAPSVYENPRPSQKERAYSK